MELRLLGIGIMAMIFMTVIAFALDKQPAILSPSQAIDDKEYIGQKIEVQGTVIAERYCQNHVCSIEGDPFCNVCRTRFYVADTSYKLLLARKNTQWLCAGLSAQMCLKNLEINKFQNVAGTLRRTSQGNYLDVT